MTDRRCTDCGYFHRGYRLQGMRVPDFCDRHFHSQHGDDPACAQFEPKEPAGDSDDRT